MSTPEKIVITVDDDEVELPTKFEVCGRCEGRGTHTNPSIDGNGLTAEDFAEAGDDFREDYMSGVYDVQCYECKGARVVAVVDRDRCDKKLLKAWDNSQREEANYRAECEMERRMGA